MTAYNRLVAIAAKFLDLQIVLNNLLDRIYRQRVL